MLNFNKKEREKNKRNLIVVIPNPLLQSMLNYNNFHKISLIIFFKNFKIFPISLILIKQIYRNLYYDQIKKQRISIFFVVGIIVFLSNNERTSNIAA